MRNGQSFYVHDTPGRLRVKIPALRGNPYMCHRVKDLVQDVDGVAEVSINSVTGSVLVSYDESRLSGPQILGMLSERGYFDRSRAITNEQFIETSVSRAGKSVGKAVLGWAVGKAIEDTGFAIIAALI